MVDSTLVDELIEVTTLCIMQSSEAAEFAKKVSDETQKEELEFIRERSRLLSHIAMGLSAEYGLKPRLSYQQRAELTKRKAFYHKGGVSYEDMLEHFMKRPSIRLIADHIGQRGGKFRAFSWFVLTLTYDIDDVLGFVEV